MKNKLVIRKERNENNLQLFVRSIPKSIIEDTRLSANGLRLLLSILGDNDETFSLSQSTYSARFNWDEKSFKRAIDNLIQCGYITRKLIDSKRKMYFYTISEYGGLNNNTKVQLKTKQPKENYKKELSLEDVKTRFNIKINTLKINVDKEGLEDRLTKSFNEGKIKESLLTDVNMLKLISKFEIKETVNEETKQCPITDEEINDFYQAAKAITDKGFALPLEYNKIFKPYFEFNLGQINDMKSNLESLDQFKTWLFQFEPYVPTKTFYTGQKLIAYVHTFCNQNKGMLKNNDIRVAFTNKCIEYFDRIKNQTIEEQQIKNKILGFRCEYTEASKSID